MRLRDLDRREILRRLSLLVAVGSAAMLVVSSWMYVRSPDAAGAVTLNGSLTVSPGSGTSAEDYTLGFASGVGIACPGDSATGGYLLQGFIVPSGTAIDGLTFNAIGPSTGFSIQDAAGSVVLNQTVEVVTGNVTQLPGAFSFANNSPGDFPTGDYEVGLACTQGNGAGMVKTYWVTTMTLTADAAAGPAQITWQAAGSGTTTTTTTGGSTTTTAGGSTTTTTTGGSTTTTTDAATTTTTEGSTTTTTIGADVSGSDITGGTPSAASPVTTAGQLPFTGSSPLPMVFWAICLIVFGRMAMLIGKRTKVVGDDVS